MLRDEDVMREIRRRWGSWHNFEQAWIAGERDALVWMSNPKLFASIQAAYYEDEAPAPKDYRARPPRDAWAFKPLEQWTRELQARYGDDNDGDNSAPTPTREEKSGAARIFDEADAFLNTTTPTEGTGHE
jgi:hypothetical protein